MARAESKGEKGKGEEKAFLFFMKRDSNHFTNHFESIFEFTQPSQNKGKSWEQIDKSWEIQESHIFSF